MKTYKELLEKVTIPGFNKNYFTSSQMFKTDVEWDDELGTGLIYYGPTKKGFSIVAHLSDFSRVKVATFSKEADMMKVIDTIKKAKNFDYFDFKKLKFQDA